MLDENDEYSGTEESEESLFKDFSEEDSDGEYYGDLDGFDPNAQTNNDSIDDNDQNDVDNESNDKDIEIKSEETESSSEEISSYESTSEEESYAERTSEEVTSEGDTAEEDSDEQPNPRSDKDKANWKYPSAWKRRHNRKQDLLLRELSKSKAKRFLDQLNARHSPTHLLNHLKRKDSEKLLALLNQNPHNMFTKYQGINNFAVFNEFLFHLQSFFILLSFSQPRSFLALGLLNTRQCKN